jgi:orotate phosphoribosyltransferase
MLDIQVANALIEIQAVGFSPQQPVTFKSGIISPAYVDNRRLIYWPDQWKLVIEGFQTYLVDQNLQFDVIAGIATGGVPHSSVLAYNLKKPSVYVRQQSKDHGTQNLIEGGNVRDRRVLLVEDMITTGGSSLNGVRVLREAGATVTDCLAVTSYGFAMSQQAFQVAQVQLHTLTTFPVIVQESYKRGTLNPAELSIVEDWLVEPHHWAERQNFEDVST